MITVTTTSLESIPGEVFLTENLQNTLIFTLGHKLIKQGKLVLFRRAHYYYHITILTNKNNKESFEIPVPFITEEYREEGLAYFDYRLASIKCTDSVKYKLNNVRVKNISPSQYYNKILEIQTKKA